MIDDAKPYPAYKDSGHPWLSDVPEHWEVLSLRRFSRVFAGATPSRDVPEYWNGDIPWLSSGDVNKRKIVDASQRISSAGFRNSSTKWIRPRSTVMALAGQGKTKGMVATVEMESTCNQSMAVIEPDEYRLNNDLLAYSLETQYKSIRALVGDGLRDGLNLQHVKDLRVPVPPPAEQAGIVKVLGAVDRRVNRLVRAKRRLLGLLAEQKQAVITHAVTRGLDPHAPTKPSGVEFVGEVPSHWDVQRLSTVCDFRAGKAHEPFVNEIGRFICVNARFVSTDGKTRKFCTQNLCPARKHDVLMVMSDLPNGRALARAFHADEDDLFAVNQRVCALTPTGVNPRFLFYYANRNLQLLRHDDGWDQTHLSNGDYKTMRVLLPPGDEQAGIAEHLDEFAVWDTAAADLARREIDLIREYRTRLVADVVTGKLDVRAVAESLDEEVDNGDHEADPESLNESDHPVEEPHDRTVEPSIG